MSMRLLFHGFFIFFEIFQYLIKEKMAGQKHWRENLTLLLDLNYWVSSWLNFRFSQIS